MQDAIPDPSTLPLQPEIASIAPTTESDVVDTRDVDALRYHLRHDPVTHVYQLGDLDPAFFPFSRWFATHDARGRIESLMLLYEGLRLPAVLTTGSTRGVEALLEQTRDQLPERFHYHVHPPHLPMLERVYETRRAVPMVRMALQRASHRAGGGRGVERLGHRDTGAIVALYRHYPDNFFEPYQLESGLYFGVREEGELVSIAGIHVLSERDDVAAIGNLLTHPEHRGRGLATRCTTRLLDELFERVGWAALSVRQDNAPGVRMFERLGFERHHVYHEGIAERREG